MSEMDYASEFPDPPPSEAPVFDRRAHEIRGLRELADFLDANPTVPMPILHLNAFANTRAELTTVARVAGWRKLYQDVWFILKREFSGAVTFEVNIARHEVCRREVVGTKIVPAQPAIPEHAEEVYVWKCDEPLLAETA